MATFFARVELHKATAPDYEKLHEAMQKIDFFRFVLDRSEKNNHLYLPTGCYVSYNLGTLSDVAGKVRTVANSVIYLNKVYCAKVESDVSYLDNF